MNFIISRDTLLTPLQQIVNVIEKKQTMPILANVLMKFNDAELWLTGTDLEIQIVAKVAVTSAGPGEITVPARKLLDICRSFSADTELKFSFDGDKLKITSRRSRFSLSTLPAGDYPEFTEGKMEAAVTLSCKQFRNALDKTAFCMGHQDVRYYLNGLMLNIFNNTFKLVASDGHRLASYEDQLEQSTGTESRIIIPRKGVIELTRLLDDPEAEVALQYSGNNIKIRYKNLVFSAKLIDSKYPDYSKALSQTFKAPLEIEKQGLKDAITRVAILANEKSKGVNLDIKEDYLKISTHNPEQEEAEEELSIDYQGAPLMIAFNAQYLLDAISNIDGKNILFTVAENGSCCVIEEPDNELFRFVVMSMRI